MIYRATFTLFLFYLLNLLFSASLYTLQPDKKITQYVHRVFDTNMGLPQNSAYEILQSQNGYLWIGTGEGLVRYDGIHFSVYDKYNTEAIKHNTIRALYEDRKGNLWIGTTGGGVNILKDNIFQSITERNGLSSSIIVDIIESSKGEIWICTRDKGIDIYKNSQIINSFNKNNGLVSNNIRAIHEDRYSNMWIGTLEKGIIKYQDGVFSSYNKNNGLSSNKISTIHEDSQGILWIGTMRGLDKMVGNKIVSYNKNDGLTSNSIVSIYEDSDSTLWIGTNDGGLCRVIDRISFTVESYTQKDGLSSNIIRSIYEDKEGLLYVGTSGGGINQFRDGKFTHLTTSEGLSNNMVKAVMIDSRNRLFVGTYGGGLNVFERDKIVYHKTNTGFPSNVIYSLFEDSNNHIWVGTYGSGVIKIENGRYISYTSKNGLSSDLVSSISEDKNGNIWIGTYGGGINRFDGSKFISYTTKNGLSNNIVLCTTVDDKNNVWIGTSGGGLNCYRNSTISVINTDSGLSNDIVLSLYEDDNSTLWCGTRSGGLNKIVGSKVISYTTNDGLFDDNIHTILEDSKNNLWMSCNKGIFRINKNDIMMFDKGLSKDIPCQSFGIKDGMKTAECNGGSKPSGWMERDKHNRITKLYFASIKGVISINPDNIKQNNVPPDVHIESILSDGIDISGDKEINLPYDMNNLLFRFTACSFTYPKSVEYRYILDGFDQRWHKVNYEKRYVNYTNLPSGNYSFRIKASNNDNKWSKAISSSTIVIATPFYFTYWFFGLSGVLLGIIVYFIYRVRVNHLTKRQKELQHKIREHAIKLNNANIERRNAEEATKLKTQFLANISHELRTPLNGILGFCQLVMTGDFPKSVIIQYISRIYKVGKHLLEVINDLLDITKIESGKEIVFNEEININELFHEIEMLFVNDIKKQGLDFVININRKMPDVINSDYSKIKRILINLIGNALKFTEKGNIRVDVNPANKNPFKRSITYVIFSVSDTGIGISEDKRDSIFNPFEQVDNTLTRKYHGTGLGLSITKHLVELLDGKIWFESKENEGTTFYFTVSIK